MKKIKTYKKKLLGGTGIIVVAAVTLIGVHYIFGANAQSQVSIPTQNSTNSPATTFNYGFDFDGSMTTSPTAKPPNVQDAVTSALNVMSHFSGSMMAQSIYGSGAANPEPNPVPAATPLDSTNTNLASIASRISLITNAGGTPVINFIAAPNWMVACTNYAVGTCPGGDTSSTCVGDTNTQPLMGSPPCPAHFQDYAKLCAYIASQFPQVKYFVVWSEMRGFYNSQTQTNDDQNFTQMYNDIYTAVKHVRSDALVGGPYANLYSTPCNQPPNYPAACPAGSLSGQTGYFKPYILQSLQYWLANKVGADFVDVDGGTETASKCTNSITTGYSCGNGYNLNIDPVTASQKYAVVDNWIRSQTSLPIWWMESHIQPEPGSPNAWTDPQAAAARIATLIIMNTSGASVGMQWNPQDTPVWADMGLWTSTQASVANGGGQATVLGAELPSLLPQISQALTLVNGQPTGVLVAKNSTNAILVNTNNINATAVLNGANIGLGAGQVLVKPLQTSTTPSGGSTTPSQGATGASSATNSSTTQSGSNFSNSGSNTGASVAQLSNVQPSGTPELQYKFDTKNVTKAQYYLDKKLLATVTKYPFTYKLNTTKILNGTYTYSVKIFYSTGQVIVSSNKITIKNKTNFTQLSLIAQKYSPGLISTAIIVVIIVFVAIRHPFRLFLKHAPAHLTIDPTIITPMQSHTEHELDSKDDQDTYNER